MLPNRDAFLSYENGADLRPGGPGDSERNGVQLNLKVFSSHSRPDTQGLKTHGNTSVDLVAAAAGEADGRGAVRTSRS